MEKRKKTKISSFLFLTYVIIYYNLRDFYMSHILSKTKVLDMENIDKTIIFDVNLNFSSMDLNYFGMEIMRDLKKKIIKFLLF